MEALMRLKEEKEEKDRLAAESKRIGPPTPFSPERLPNKLASITLGPSPSYYPRQTGPAPAFPSFDDVLLPDLEPYPHDLKPNSDVQWNGSGDLYPKPGPRVPAVDRSTKPATSDAFDKRDSRSNAGLRELAVPSTLVPKFQDLAAANTRANVETCGILGGRLEGGRLLISCLVIPAQSGTSDSCTTAGEEELFTVMDSRFSRLLNL